MNALSLSVKIVARVTILKIKHIEEKPVYQNTAAHWTTEAFSYSPFPRFSRDISEINVYATVREFMLFEELQLCISWSLCG